jgi:hypothetical protein
VARALERHLGEAVAFGVVLHNPRLEVALLFRVNGLGFRVRVYGEAVVFGPVLHNPRLEVVLLFRG